MKSADAEARQLSRILLDSAIDGMVPLSTIRACVMLPPSACKISKVTLDEARRSLCIPLEVFEQEHHRHSVVADIIAGAGRAGAGRAVTRVRRPGCQR